MLLETLINNSGTLISAGMPENLIIYTSSKSVSDFGLKKPAE